MLNLVHGNRVELLADALADCLEQSAAGSVLAPDRIVIQSKGMARWLTFRLAQRQGVAANLMFPFPAAHIWDTFRALLGEDVPDESSYRPEVLNWRILEILEQGLDRPELEPLRRYIEGGDAARRHALANRIADTYDGYLIYRPDWIDAWEHGHGSDWQAALWRIMTQSTGCHRVTLQKRALERLMGPAISAGTLPERLHVFGIAALPPSYCEILRALALVSDVWVYFLNPCEAYWGDIVSEKALAKAKREGAQRAAYLDVGHPLLASWGRQGRDCLDQWLAADPIEHPLFQPAETATLLCRLQNDILTLNWREYTHGGEDVRFTPDDSIQVHVCHSGMREVEVLQDRLFAMFANDAALDPGQIVVLTPDIDTYGPYIEAVFGSESGNRWIPFSIADRSARQDSAIADALLSLLETLNSRFEADRVLSLLDHSALRRRFGLTEDDRERLVDWVRDLGVRWGVDGAMRAEQGVPATHEHSWRFGLERLVLGFALPEGSDPEVFGHILPDGRLDAGGTQILGRFLQFFDCLTALRQRSRLPRHPAAWAICLEHTLDQFFLGDNEEGAELQQIRDAITGLAQASQEAGYQGEVPLEVVLEQLQQRLDRGRGAGRFLTGGVTFCAMVPMRSVPFQVVCLIGLNDGVYPRLDSHVDFDRLGQDWRRGDRSGREDDRYLFLEAILSARRRLYLSYVGISQQDNSTLPPSVLVAELLDTLDRAYGARPGEVREAIQVRHPLHAFDPAYFRGNSPLFSYSAELLDAARAQASAKGLPSPLFNAPLADEAPLVADLTLDQLTGFLLNPSRHFLEQGLGIRLIAGEGALSHREPFELDRRGLRRLQQSILAYDATQRDQQGHAVARAAGMLPHGPVGDLAYQDQSHSVRAFESQYPLLSEFSPMEPLDFHCTVADTELSGRLEVLSSHGLHRVTLSKVSPWDWLRLWVSHLCLNASAPCGVVPESHLFGGDGYLLLRPVADSRALLARLVALLSQGRREPLPFFPNASKVFVKASRSARSGVRPALDQAQAAWLGTGFVWAEADDAHVDYVYRREFPADKRFGPLALEVWEPLFEAAEWS